MEYRQRQINFGGNAVEGCYGISIQKGNSPSLLGDNKSQDDIVKKARSKNEASSLEFTMHTMRKTVDENQNDTLFRVSDNSSLPPFLNGNHNTMKGKKDRKLRVKDNRNEKREGLSIAENLSREKAVAITQMCIPVAKAYDLNELRLKSRPSPKRQLQRTGILKSCTDEHRTSTDGKVKNKELFSETEKVGKDSLNLLRGNGNPTVTAHSSKKVGRVVRFA